MGPKSRAPWRRRHWPFMPIKYRDGLRYLSTYLPFYGSMEKVIGSGSLIAALVVILNLTSSVSSQPLVGFSFLFWSHASSISTSLPQGLNTPMHNSMEFSQVKGRFTLVQWSVDWMRLFGERTSRLRSNVIEPVTLKTHKHIRASKKHWRIPRGRLKR